MAIFFQVFLWPTTRLVVWKSITKVPNQKVSRRPKSFSSVFFRLASSNLCDCFTMVLAQTAAFYTEQCTSPSLFQNFEVSRGGLNQWLKNYGFIYNALFFTCMHAHKSLGNEMYLLLKIADLKIQLMCMETGRALSSIVACLRILQPILHTSTEKASEDRLAALR